MNNSKNILEFLFGLSQEKDDTDNLLEELSGALSGTEALKPTCKELKKTLKSIGVDCKVCDHCCRFDNADDYKIAVELCANNLNELVDAGWVYAQGGDVNMIGTEPEWVIHFTPVCAADDDNEKRDHADIEKIAKDARELGDAPLKGDQLRKEQASKYDSYVSDSDTAVSAVNRLLEKSATAVANWRVRTFDSEEKETDTWVIRDRTEAEARREAESDPTVQDSHDWTMTAAEIEESAVTESEEEKSRLSTMMSSTGLVRVDVGEGNDRYWATGETGKTRNVSVGTVQRACRRLFPDREFRVNRRGTNIHCILWKVKEDAAKDAKKAKAKKIDESDVRERMLDDGYEPNGVSWMSPRTGEILSFEQAREEYLNTQSLLRNGWVDEERGWCSPDGVCMTFEEACDELVAREDERSNMGADAEARDIYGDAH